MGGSVPGTLFSALGGRLPPVRLPQSRRIPNIKTSLVQERSMLESSGFRHRISQISEQLSAKFQLSRPSLSKFRQTPSFGHVEGNECPTDRVWTKFCPEKLDG